MKTQFQTGPFLIWSYRTWILFLFEIVEKPASGIAEGSISGVPCLRRGYSAEGYEGRERLRAHRLGALRVVRPHVLHVRFGCRSPCGLARGTARLGVHGLGG